jgi:hypothetical protein
LKKLYLVIGFLCILFTFSIADVSFAQSTYSYQYDNNGKLKEVYKDGNLIMTFVYDDNGNLTKKVVPLQGPTNLTASLITYNSVQLSWTPIQGASSYSIYQNGVKLSNTVVTNSVNVSNLTPNTDYSFQVTAIINSLESGKSNQINVKTLLFAPTNLIASSLTSNSVLLSWTGVSGANSYNIYQNGVKLTTSSTTNSYSVGNLNPNTTYTFSVAASIGSTESSKSNQITVKTLPIQLSAPTGLFYENITTNSLTLYWNPVSGATTYYIYRKEPSATMYTHIATTTLTSKDIQNLNSGTTYSFVVRAYNGNLSPNSNEVIATTLNAPISDTFEPNNSISTAYYIEPGRIDSFIYSPIDVDYYKIMADVSGIINLELVSPYMKDYDIYLYSNSGQLLSSDMRFNGDRITYNTNGGQFYIKIVGHNSNYSTSNVYSLNYQFTQGTGAGSYCPPKLVCRDDGETMLSFTSEGDTELTSSEPSFRSITPEQSLTLENLYQPEVTFDEKVEAYVLLSEIGVSEDIYWLEEESK